MELQKVYKTIEIEELVREIGIWSNNPSEKKMELFSDLNQAKEYVVQTIQKLVGYHCFRAYRPESYGI